ncbi:MAG TPA: ATP-binding cassette domain-containing protein [Vitreimonas sp.]|nr:ATP-binding cassette domain-containing protein [Vitreimonas sp.]
MITFSAVTKIFPDTSIGLEGVTFSVKPGEFVVITGHSGSGKTTLMKLLTKEYSLTTGEILFEDTSLTEMRSSHIPHHRRKIGVVFQDYKLLPEYNVWENIALPLYIVGKPESEIESRVTDLLKLVGLVDKAFLFPSQLSGGEAQRVSIARALATGPSVVFADEPTGNLDPETSASIARLLTKINELGTTILMATHDIGVLESLSHLRHLQLEKGRLVKDTHASVMPSEATPTQHTSPTQASQEPTAEHTQQETKIVPTPRSHAHVEPPSPEKPKLKPTEEEKVSPQADELPHQAVIPISSKKGPRLKLRLPSFSWPFKKKPGDAKKPAEKHSPTDDTSAKTTDDNETENKPKIQVEVESLD